MNAPTGRVQVRLLLCSGSARNSDNRAPCRQQLGCECQGVHTNDAAQALGSICFCLKLDAPEGSCLITGSHRSVLSQRPKLQCTPAKPCALNSSLAAQQQNDRHTPPACPDRPSAPAAPPCCVHLPAGMLVRALFGWGHAARQLWGAEQGPPARPGRLAAQTMPPTHIN